MALQIRRHIFFSVGIFDCCYEKHTEERAIFWIKEDGEWSPMNLSVDDRFSNLDYMKYFDENEHILRLPKKEVYKIIQHLIRLNELKALF